MSPSLAIQSSLVIAGLVLALHGCDGTSKASRKDAGAETGGVVPTGGSGHTGGSTASNDASATGGAAGGGGTGGNPGTGGASKGTGGAVSTGGTSSAPGTGGAAGVTSTGGIAATGGITSTGGIAATGGIATTGGVAGTGGSTGSGGTRASGGSGGSTALDSGTTDGCTCTSGKTTLECFRSKYACPDRLGYFQPGGAAAGMYSTLEEYADCNLVLVTRPTGIAPDRYVFDRSTGRLVGARYSTDVGEPCPWGSDAGVLRVLSAGEFPASTCVRSGCRRGTLPDIMGTCADAGI